MRLHAASLVRSLLLGTALLGASGCAHYPINAPLSPSSSDFEYRFDRVAPGPDNTDELFICLAFSGGGTRAAALSYGVLEKLRNTRIVWNGKEKSLLDEVDVISAVSGGSFTAAYFGLFGNRLFTDFREKFLEANIQGGLAIELLKPWTWFKLASLYYDRIDLAADYYNSYIFEGKTFGDLEQAARRPFIVINATNLADGERFEFTQDEFDFIGSDLSSFPVARAVAASSALPFLLSPVSLRNHPRATGLLLPSAEKSDMTNALRDFRTNRERYQWAKNRAAYADATAMPFLHLMDGGLADNIGVRAIDRAFRRGFLRRRINEGRIKRLLVIVVNALTDHDSSSSKREYAPGLADVAYKTATVAQNNYSFDSIESLRALLNARKEAQDLLQTCHRQTAARAACVRQEYSASPDRIPPVECQSEEPSDFAATLKPSVAVVDFEALLDVKRHQRFLSIGTSFSLDRGTVKDLIDVGGELLAQDPEFQRTIADLLPHR